MIYNLNIPEAYLIFSGLKYIFSCDLSNKEIYSTPIRIKNDFNITKLELKDILNREIILLNKNEKIKWIDNICYKKQYITIIFNQEIFKLFDENFIDFVKNLKFDFKHISTLRFLELFHNKTKLFLNLETLKTLDNNSYIYKYNLEKEKNRLLNLDKTKDDQKINLKKVNDLLDVIKKEKSFDFYLKHLTIIKSELLYSYNIKINFKLTKNQNEEIGFKIKKVIEQKNKDFKYETYLKSILHMFIKDKNKIFNYKKSLDI